jgi:hypothetical protein
MMEPVRRQLSLLLSAYGYNLYDKKNRARADDLLVREKAAAALAEATTALATLRTAYRRRFIPPPTREHPDPPSDRMAHLREMAEVQERLSTLETHIRSMPVPTQDHVWEQFRREKVLLDELLTHDLGLIEPSQELLERVQALGVQDWSDEAAAGLRAMADRVERELRARAGLLQTQG